MIAEAEVTAARNDFCGVTGIDLYIAEERASAVWAELARVDGNSGAVPIGDAVVEVVRIEAGLPCPLREITDDVLPAETGQFDRAVSYTKGCYLGQEIVERMRSRGVVARVLSGLVFEGEVCPPMGAPVRAESGSTIGTLTSTCTSLALRAPIGLAYLKQGSAEPETRARVVWDDGDIERSVVGRVVSLPFVGKAAH
jgi:folate-binding protein YgfZ